MMERHGESPDVFAPSHEGGDLKDYFSPLAASQGLWRIRFQSEKLIF